MVDYKADPISSTDGLDASGLGRPPTRTLAAFAALAGVLYAAGAPKCAFNDEGCIRPLAIIQPGPESVMGKHFLVIPIGVALAVFLFT